MVISKYPLTSLNSDNALPAAALLVLLSILNIFLVVDMFNTGGVISSSLLMSNDL